MDDIKRTLMALPLYAADFQEAEMQLVPQYIQKGETMQAAISACYRQIRSLLLLTDQRIIVLNAKSEPALLLDLPLERIERLFASMWYNAGNVTCYAADSDYFFSLMSTAAYVPLAKKIEELADKKREQLLEVQ